MGCSSYLARPVKSAHYLIKDRLSFISESFSQTLRTKWRQSPNMLLWRKPVLQGRHSAWPLVPNPDRYFSSRRTSFSILRYTQLRKFSLSSRCHTYLMLADLNPVSQQPIHLLIGADLYGSLKRSPSGSLGLRNLSTKETAIGWIILAPTSIASHNVNKAQVLHCISECDTNSLLHK